jgi:DNA polymerase III alpha subunit
MVDLFKDAPELIDNTVEVAKRCSLEIRLGSSMLPAYPVPSGTSIEDYLRAEAVRGLQARLTASHKARADESHAAKVSLKEAGEGGDFPGREKQDVFPAAPGDGFTASR